MIHCACNPARVSRCPACFLLLGKPSRLSARASAVSLVCGAQAAGEVEDRLLPLLPKLRRQSMSQNNGEVPASPVSGEN